MKTLEEFEFWFYFALKDSRISKIVFPAWLVRIARLDALSPVENSGYYVGVVNDGVFYVCGLNRLCWGKASPIDAPGKRVVGIIPDLCQNWVFGEQHTQAFARKTNGAATILWHSHPKTTVSDLHDICGDEATNYTSVLQEELDAGEYGHLTRAGKPTLDDVVNEVLSRKLSPADIEFTPGCAHILLTDTFLPGQPLSVINAYQIVPDSRAVGKIPTELLGKQSRKVRDWYRNIHQIYMDAFHEVGAMHEAVFETLTTDEVLRPSRIPPERYLL